MRLLYLCLLPLPASAFIQWEASTLTGTGSSGPLVDGPPGVAAFSLLRPTANPVLDADGTVYLTDNNAIRSVSPSGVMTTLAGGSASGYANGVGTAAAFASPRGLSGSSATGRLLLYLVDNTGNRVRTLDPATATAGVLAGGGATGAANGVGTLATFSVPTGTAVSGDGLVLYVADWGNHLIRAVVTQTRQVSTFAGTSAADGSGGGWLDGPLLNARFNFPMAVATGADGTTLYVLDKFNLRLRVIAGGMVSTVVGFGPGAPAVTDGVGASASFFPALTSGSGGMAGLAVGADGNVYIADACRVRVVTPAGAMRTLAGGAVCGFADGASALRSAPASNATLISNSPNGLAVSPTGDRILLLDSYRLRVLAPPLPPAAPVCTVTTLVGGKDPGYLDGPAAAARISNPYGLALSASGKVYFSDNGNNLIRALAGDSVATIAGNGALAPPPGQPLDGAGSSAYFNSPRGLALVGETLLVVAEYASHRVRAVPVNGSATYTLAGSGFLGYSDAQGTAARFNSPWGLAVASSASWPAAPPGAVVYIADSGNNRVRALWLGNGTSVTTMAGSGLSANTNGVGTAASLRGPYTIAIPSGAMAPPGVTLYVTTLHRVASLSMPSGQLTFIAGNEVSRHVNGVGSGAGMAAPRSLAWGARLGALFVGEYSWGMVSLLTTEGVLTAFAGAGSPLRGRVDGVGTDAQFDSPGALASDSDGDLILADYASNALMSITCRACGLGYFCPSPVQRLPCPPGTMGTSSATTASAACAAPCPEGFFCPAGSALASAIPCPVGSFCPEGASTPTPCAPGTFAAVEQSIFCPSCPAGSLAPVPGSGTCAKYCPPGSFRGSPGGVNASASCVPCAAGTYVPYDGATACLPCASGTWSAALGAVSAATCAPCPPLYTSPPASTSAAACVPAAFACPPGTQPALGLLAGGGAPTSPQQCSPLACPPPLLLNALGTACLGCAPRSAGAFPDCQALPCSGEAVCVGGDATPLLPFALDDSAGQQLPSEGSSTGGAAAVSLPVIGVAAGAVFLTLSLAALVLFVRRLGLMEKLDYFALKSPAAVGGHPTMNPTAAGALCSILGMATILALATIQLVGFFSMENSTRGESSGIVTPAALKGVSGLRWKGDGGLTLSLAVAARSSSDAPGGGVGSASSSSSSPCAAPLSWSATPLLQGRWVLLPAGVQATSKATPSRLARAPVTFQLDCLDCQFTPASSIQLFLHHSCQALHVYAFAPAGDGSPSFQTMDPATTCGNSTEGALAAVAWQLSPQLHVLNDTLPSFVSAGTSARGYLLMSQETTTARAPRLTTSEGAAELLPLTSAVRLTVRLPLNANMQTSTLVQRQTWVQLLTGISGLMGLLGGFGLGAALLSKLLPAPTGKQQGAPAASGAGGDRDTRQLTENPMTRTQQLHLKQPQPQPQPQPLPLSALAPPAPGSAREVRLAARYLLERDDCLPPGWAAQDAAPARGGVGTAAGGSAAAPAATHVFCGPSGEQTLADPRDDTEAYVQLCLQAWRGGADVLAGAPADLGARTGEAAERLLQAGALPPRWAHVRGELVAPCGARGLPDPRSSQSAMEEEVAAELGAQARARS